MNNQQQLKQQTFSKPIVYGTISYSIGANKKLNDKNTHRWCVYVRGPNNEDLSTFIEKVVFVLHETFPDHQRAIHKPPFEVVEKGWGEFDILIQIHFKTHYPQLELVHKLKFYGAKSGGNSQSTKKPVVSEFYDEIVFVNPSIEFYDLLKIEKYLQNEEKPVVAKEIKPEETEQSQMEIEQGEKEEDDHYDWKQHYLKFDAQEHKQKLEDALAVMKVENEKIKVDSDKYDKDIEALNKEIEQLQKEYEIKQKKIQEESEQIKMNQSSQSSQPQEQNAFSYPPSNFQSSPSVPGQINEFPNQPDQMRNMPPPPIPAPTQIAPNSIPIQNLSQQNIAPPPIPPQNNYPPQQGAHPIMGGQPVMNAPPQQQVPPPHMMQNNYPPSNQNIKHNPYPQPNPNMPM